jgi:DNA-binding MarR family transcriptional regulator
VLDRRLTYLLGRVASSARDQANRALQPLGLDTRHYAVLTVIASQDAPSQRTIADALGIDRATVVALADDLEQQGFARRAPSPDDRRAKRLELTALGRQVLKRGHALMEKCEARFVGTLSVAEQRQLGAMLEKLLPEGGVH